MYHHVISNPLSSLRFFVVCAVLLLGAVKAGYGQRVYANTEQHSNKQEVLFLTVSEVTAPNNSTNNTENTYSTLSVGVGALNLYSATQNLQFTGINAAKLKTTSPIMVKTMVNGSVLGLLDAVSLQRTNAGMNNTVGNPYTVTQLLDLLGIIGGTDEELLVTLPVPGVSQLNDGVQMKVSSVLSLGLSARLYYAFYIVPPEIPSTVTACENSPVDVTISNYEEAVEDQGYPYTYQLYVDQLLPSDPSIIETPIENVTFNNGILTLPATLPAGDYYLEARENDVYPSARTKITLIRNSVTGGTITGTQTLCANITPAQLSETTASTGTAPLAYQWQSKTTGGYTDVPDATSVSYAPPTLSETTMYRRATRSTANGVVCEAFSNEITITVNPVPSISLNHSSIDACQDDNTIDFPYNTVTSAPTSYSIDWNNDAIAMGFQDVSNEAHTFLTSGGNIPIVVPPDATPGTYHGVLKIQNSDGCESNGQGLIVNILPKPPAPDIDVM